MAGILRRGTYSMWPHVRAWFIWGERWRMLCDDSLRDVCQTQVLPKMLGEKQTMDNWKLLAYQEVFSSSFKASNQPEHSEKKWQQHSERHCILGLVLLPWQLWTIFYRNSVERSNQKAAKDYTERNFPPIFLMNEWMSDLSTLQI